MTFKSTWERTDQHFQLDDQAVQAMIAMALPSARYLSHRVISGGCANLNIKVQLESQHAPVILRVYLRDREAACREKKLGELLCGSIPLPTVDFVGECCGHTFAIVEHKPGITLREYLLGHDGTEMVSLMKEAGTILQKIHRVRFSCSGDFDENLAISKPLVRDDFLAFGKGSLTHPIVLSKISEAQIAKMGRHFDRFGDLLPGDKDCCLVHADYDPANILVDDQSGRWRVSAVLDWEFAFSGSPLCDVANMLRYAHQMPSDFEEAFLGALRVAGMEFPKDWRISVDLLNLLSLLDCLRRCVPDQRPNQCKDICALIAHINERLDHA